MISRSGRTIAIAVRKCHKDKQELFGGYDDLIQYPAADCNKGPILEILKHCLKVENGFVFEVASGTGQHVTHFAKHFPTVTFLPSDCDVSYLKSIQAYINQNRLTNVLSPLHIDITQPMTLWPGHERLKPESCDGIININMIHISPWETCLVMTVNVRFEQKSDVHRLRGLMASAGTLLKSGGFLYMYGPFMVDGVIYPKSNVQFDRSLRSSNSFWGLRDIADVKKLAEKNGLQLKNVEEMPANNKSVIFYKQ